MILQARVCDQYRTSTSPRRSVIGHHAARGAALATGRQDTLKASAVECPDWYAGLSKRRSCTSTPVRQGPGRGWPGATRYARCVLPPARLRTAVSGGGSCVARRQARDAPEKQCPQAAMMDLGILGVRSTGDPCGRWGRQTGGGWAGRLLGLAASVWRGATRLAKRPGLGALGIDPSGPGPVRPVFLIRPRPLPGLQSWIVASMVSRRCTQATSDLGRGPMGIGCSPEAEPAQGGALGTP